MAQKLTLSEPEQRVLRAILHQSMISGAKLLNYMGMTRPNDLITIVRNLVHLNLIEASGDFLDEKMFPYATFGTRPSAREYLTALLKEQP